MTSVTKFARDWLQKGDDIYDLSRHLGHSSVKTTEICLGGVTRSGHQIGHMFNGLATENGSKEGANYMKWRRERDSNPRSGV